MFLNGFVSFVRRMHQIPSLGSGRQRRSVKSRRTPANLTRAAAAERLEGRELLSATDLAAIGASQQTQQQSFLYNPAGSLTNPSSADAETIARNYLTTHSAQLGVTNSDVINLTLTGRTTGYQGQGVNLYFQQTYNGLPVEGSTVNVSTDSQGRIVSIGNRLVPNVAARITGSAKYLTSLEAVTATGKALNAAALSGVNYQVSTTYPSTITSFSGGNLSRDTIPMKLVYQPTADGSLHLAWNSVVRMTTGSDWFYTNVDAVTGTELYQNNWTHYEDFTSDSSGSGTTGGSSSSLAGTTGSTASSSLTSSFATGITTSNAGTGSYRVFNYNLEDPNDGTRSLITDPEDATASPYGWHDTNATSGAEFTDTRGNNVFAQEDADANDTGGFRPDGGAGLSFDFALDLTQSPTSGTNQSAGITNLFYINNILHDLHYQYGFDEASGNFQVNNYGKGGVGNDQVYADAQDGSGMDNANFATPPDGFNPRMQMYLFDLTNPQRDGDLANNVIIHEFGHGVSTRLTGGPANSNALDALQSGGMGEGWGDFWGLMLNQKPSDQQNDAYPSGTWVLGQPSGGPGIRRYPYSYNMSIDPLTYDDFNGGYPNNEVHNAGEIWCSTLWDMNWLLINRHGYSSDLYDGTAGNNMALELVMEGLKLQPANPSFLDARDAILAADQKLNAGANQDLIWQAFARRGMGVNAYDGGNANSEEVVADFEVPKVVDYRDLLNEGIGSFRDGKFFLDANLNKAYNGTGGGDFVQVFGNPTDIPLVGDWDGNDIDQVGVFRNGTFYLDYNGNGKWDNVSGGDKFFKFGNPTDKPVVGDWNKDGKTDIGVFRDGKWYLDRNGDGKWGAGDTSFNFGLEGDVPITGDFNGDGRSEVGVFRQGRWYLDLNGNHKWDGPAKGDASPQFGNPTDKPVTGDWNNAGRDKIGVFREGVFYLDGNGDRHWNGAAGGDTIAKFGGQNDIPLVGRWINPQTLPPKTFAASALIVSSEGSASSGTPQAPLAEVIQQGAYVGFATSSANGGGSTNSVASGGTTSSSASPVTSASQTRSVVPLSDEDLGAQITAVFSNPLAL